MKLNDILFWLLFLFVMFLAVYPLIFGVHK